MTDATTLSGRESAMARLLVTAQFALLGVWLLSGAALAVGHATRLVQLAALLLGRHEIEVWWTSCIVCSPFETNVLHKGNRGEHGVPFVNPLVHGELVVPCVRLCLTSHGEHLSPITSLNEI